MDSTAITKNIRNTWMSTTPIRTMVISLLVLGAMALPSTRAMAAAGVSLINGPWSLDIQKPIFPSLILSTSMMKFPDPRVIGDPHSLVRIKITPNVANANIQVTATVDGLARTSEYDGTLGPANQTYTVAPTIRWKNSSLLNLFQPRPDTITVAVSLNGISLGSKTESVEIHSVNDVPFSIVNKGRVVDTSFLFAAFVNENSPLVEQILQDALHYKAVGQFVGYQEGPQQVMMQVFAIWNVLQHHHVRYSSITPPSVNSTNFHSQTVRFIEQSWNSQQANCVDGSVLFASVLYKIGLYPVLVEIPGHMFIGYYTDQRDEGTLRNMQFLETTLVGVGELPHFNIPFGKILNLATDSNSYREFIAATNEGDHEYNTEVLPELIRHAPGYDIIDIQKARAVGITPISE